MAEVFTNDTVRLALFFCSHHHNDLLTADYWETRQNRLAQAAILCYNVS